MTSSTPFATPVSSARSRTPKIDVREVLIRCGVELCTEAGFQTTGIETILRRVGVPKGSFYHYFKNKHEFGLAVIDSYANYFAKKLNHFLTDDSFSPLQRLRNFTHNAQSGMVRFEFRRGCLVGNLGQELAGLDEEFRNQLENVLRDWERQTAVCLDDAKEAGEIAKDANTQDLAAFFWIGWEGAILRSKLTRSSAPMVLFADRFFEHIVI